MSGRGPGAETSEEKIGIKTQKSDASDIDYRKSDGVSVTDAAVRELGKPCSGGGVMGTRGKHDRDPGAGFDPVERLSGRRT